MLQFDIDGQVDIISLLAGLLILDDGIAVFIVLDAGYFPGAAEQALILVFEAAAADTRIQRIAQRLIIIAELGWHALCAGRDGAQHIAQRIPVRIFPLP